MRVLLIWEDVPENTYAYLIENPTEEQLEILRAANGKYIGTDADDSAVQAINRALGDDDSAWNSIKCRVEFPVEGPIDLVVIMGCIL